MNIQHMKYDKQPNIDVIYLYMFIAIRLTKKQKIHKAI